MSGEVTLLDALERANSNNITDRKQGLLDLKHVLRSSGNNFQNLEEDSVQHLYKVLFDVAIKEQAIYLKSSTTTTRTAAENRLSACSSALRLAVEVGVRYVKLKTAESVIEHVSQTLRVPGGGFCEPLALDYAKCLKSLLSYQPHVEHFRQEVRERVASFCIDCVKVAEAELADDDSTPGADATSVAGTIHAVSYRSSRSHFKESGSSQSSRSSAKQVAEEMITCLSLLTAAPNATPGSKASELLSALIGFLQNSAIGGRSHQDAFAAINHILAWIRTESIELTRKNTSPLIRLIKHYWSFKPSFELKAEMLVTWTYLRPYVFSAMSHSDGLTLRFELNGVLDAMRNEYSARKERDQLLLSDLTLEFHNANFTPPSDISFAIFRLRCGKTSAESNWTIAYMLATLCNSLGSLNEDSAPSEDDDEEDEVNTRPRKRQRLTSEFEETLSSSSSGSTSGRVCALQILAFLAQQKPLFSKQITKAIDALSLSSTDDNVTVSSWAMLALASFASQDRSTEASLSTRWASTWQIACRAISNASTCRTACHLISVMLRLRLVPQQSVSELIQIVTSSMDLNGPSILADSVTHLLSSVIRISQQVNPASSSAAAESVLSWSFRHFQPSKFDDRDYASQHLLYEPGDMIELVTCSLAQLPHDTKMPQYLTWESVGQAWLRCAQEKELIDYLLLLPDPPIVTHKEIRSDWQTHGASSPSRVSCESLVLNHLISEVYRAHEAWKRIVREKPRVMSLDVFNSFCKTCVIVTCIAFCDSFRDSRRQSQLQRQVKDLLSVLADFIPTGNCSQEQVDAMLTTFSSACIGLAGCESHPNRSECELQICQTISKCMAARKSNRNIQGFDEDEDDMDLDSAEESQESRLTNHLEANFDLKNEYAVRFSNMALRAGVTTYATIITIQHSADSDITESSSTKTVNYILSLSETSILASQNVISSLLRVDVELAADDSYRLLDQLANRTIESESEDYVFERSEVCLAAILDLMSSLTPVSTDKANEKLYNLGVDMYNWFASVVLRSGVLSPSVQSRVASLLLQLCHVDTDYGRDDEHKIPSVRTSLFKLVHSGSVRVQFYLASRISTIFGLFVLSNHSAMFRDLQDSLPEDAESIEGMAMRLLFLAKLASAWHSLLRECVYYIFETAGRIVSSAQHASHNIAELAASLKFHTPKKLFRLFAPQLLHTWLASNGVEDLPYAIFQYGSLHELLDQNQHEITSQLLVWGNDQRMQVVLDSLGTTKKDLITHCFPKCIAYSICQDISRPSKDPNSVTYESRLRNIIGSKEEYKTLVANQFATIIGQVYLSSSQDDVHDSWLEKRPGYGAAAKALDDMKNFSHSDKILQTSQQPCFKSKYLYDEIERIARRTARNHVSPWDPSSFSNVVRILLDSIEDALGPLHTCLVIRKVRWLICTGGDIPLTGLPLEMLIHTLRPFLDDSQCADDVMGVLHYLFQHGRQHLLTNMPFFYGTVILMILQMRRHSAAKLDSTTQESQHKSTIETMRKFQDWLVNYLQGNQASNGTSGSHFYSRIANALANVNLPGNARKQSPESTLLLLLLEQDHAQQAFLTEPDRKEALTLLSHKFEVPASVREDCLELDEDCVRFSDGLWRVIQIDGLSEAFITWAANAIGRAYASNGTRPSMNTRPGQKEHSSSSSTGGGIEKSKAIIAQRLSNLLFSRIRSEAGLADYTLREILISFREPEDAIAFEQMLPTTIIPAIQHGTQGYKPFFSLTKSTETDKSHALRHLLEPSSDSTLEVWAQSVSLLLCRNAAKTDILPALSVALENNKALALELLPCIIHILLVQELDKDKVLRTELSASLAAHFSDPDHALHRKQQYLISLLLYLRERPYPGETTHADRLLWLDVDWLVASKAATRCNMPTAALLFAESMTQPSSGNRRASSRSSMSQIQVPIAQVPEELLLTIFKGVEEPDSFYGVAQPASLDSILGRLDYEANGLKSLMFRSAQTDTHLRLNHKLADADGAGLVRSLSMLNLNSLTLALLSGGFGPEGSSEEFLKSARRLQQWDVVPPETTFGAASNCFAAFQELSRANDSSDVQMKLRSIILSHITPMTSPERSSAIPHEWFSALASLSEIAEVVDNVGRSGARSSWNLMQRRQKWMSMGSYDNVSMILSNRYTLFSVLAKNKNLSTALQIGLKESRSIELESLFSASKSARAHGQLQEALVAVNQCKDLIENKQDIDLNANAACKTETASVLWDLGEVTASVKMLRDVCGMSDLEQQDIAVGRSGLLAQLAHQLAEARLEKPDDILENYLKPAISQLQGKTKGDEAGKVFHEFATFCDKQLQNPDNVEDFNRIVKLRQRKWEEVELERLSERSRKSSGDAGKESKSEKWFRIDDAEYKRLKANRDTFMEQSLRNYLQALRASDDHDISILRFFALWLENSDVDSANSIVNKFLSGVPSFKFVVLMNQVMSRLEHNSSIFQTCLRALAIRICSEHPHHSLHHLFATYRSPSGGDVAKHIYTKLKNDPKMGKLLQNIFAANAYYQSLAQSKFEGRAAKINVRELPEAYQLVKQVPGLDVPPPTISLSLRPDGNYDDVPTITNFERSVRIMGGQSAPKRLSAIASNGGQYLQLFKGGDDLRQDAIMEQVFEEVSKMLRNHKTTRHRSLNVRTYKVIPLSSDSGIIEFVPHSISFGDYLTSAHERYYPQDYKNKMARDKIASAAGQSTGTRIKEYEKVCERVHPVMRHFFFERFKNPDEWFEKRTSYTRTTASISILGYVLGLGDRHCQNIMLDEKTGEVVHIDLGIAFEAGRVLPVAELVPFRLTRDVIDGMGITKTEGVFRRCCEFTMDALREDKDSIMTLLNVLRYDPLHSWTLSPLRAKRMQEQSTRNGIDAEAAEESDKKKDQDAGEADRALSAVEKKLSKTLSTSAAVNELIQQATDVRNLATIFHGWSAYW